MRGDIHAQLGYAQRQIRWPCVSSCSLCGPVLWELYGPIAIVSPRRPLELPPTFREVNGTR